MDCAVRILNMTNKELFTLYMKAYTSKSAADLDDLKRKALQKALEVNEKESKKSLGQHALEGAGIGAGVGAGTGGLLGLGSAAYVSNKGIGRLAPVKTKITASALGGVGGATHGALVGGALGALIGLIKGYISRHS